MFKKFPIKTNFIVIGVMIGLFIGIGIKQVLGDAAGGEVRSDNLTVNAGGATNGNANGLIVAYGNALVEGNTGIGTTEPLEKLDVRGNIRSIAAVKAQSVCIGGTCINETQLKAIMSGTGTVGTPAEYSLSVIKEGTGTGTVTSSPNGINCGSACASNFSSNTTVTLTANKTTGSVFTGWSGDCSGASTTCQVFMASAKNVTATFSLAGTTPPPTETPVCTGEHPAEGNGVHLSYYRADGSCVGGGGDCGYGNTVWEYGTLSCGWSCDSWMSRDGDKGCKDLQSGTGTTITLKDLSNNRQGMKGVALSPSLMHSTIGSSAVGLHGVVGPFTTNNEGVTPEFWFLGNGSLDEWTVVVVNVPGYKIRNADGCTPSVEIWAGTTLNRCIGMKNGTPVTINMVPGDISTKPEIHLEKLTYYRSKSETVRGSVRGGDPNDTWACIDNPNTQSGHECNSGTDVWRKLTVPYDGHPDGWRLVETDKGDSIELDGLSIEEGYPLGTYTMFVKTGKWGTPSQTTSKSFTLVP